MGSVNVSIAGKTFRMACEDGQEEHLESLGRRLNDTIEELREQFGEIGDQRLTVMAAIMIADQQSEAEREVKKLEGELAGLEEARTALIERHENAEAEVARMIDGLAERLDAVAGRLTGTHPLREDR